MRQIIDIDGAITQAWDEIWKDKQTLRDDPSSFRGSEGFYITRQELIRKVRAYAYADLNKLPREGAHYDYGVRLNTNLDGRVCDWLRLKEWRKEITSHNFGRNTISGRRYRPIDAPLSPTEKETMKKAEQARGKVKPRHFAPDYLGPLLCRKGSKARSMFSRSRSFTHTTKEWEKVTCPRCLKLREA